jgi:hypothetical protein
VTGTAASTSTATCSSGDRATGGGFSFTGNISNIRIGTSQPVFATATTPTGWRVIANDTVTAYVICVDLP